MTRVIIVDDYSHTREWCAHLIKESARYNLIGCFSSASNAEIPCAAGKVDLIVMDICTEDGESGLKMAEKLKSKYPRVKIIIMTSMPEYSFVRRAREAGCESFWYKESDISLIDIMDGTMQGRSLYPEQLPVVKIGNALSSEFSQRELDVIRELVRGKSQAEIAGDLKISINTVKDHLRHIYQKTGYTKSLQVAVDAVEQKLVLPDY